ncbi:MAG TPA: DNA double-strand break repair nuclease NurA [Anaerolineaceae bacterium]|nr:DNA double-strand break repair nuclease NurA [Anaerolineaceae bacterium]HPN54231.1 DNA double-strand break repair nuclease NurA [Anaerolineaceae bacterium]
MISSSIYTHLEETCRQASQIPAPTHESLLSTLAHLQASPILQKRISQAKGNEWPGAIPLTEPITSAIPVIRRRLPLTAVDGSQIYPDLTSQVRWCYIQAVAYHIGDKPDLFSEFHPMNAMKISPDDLRGVVGGWRSALEMKAAAASSAPGRLVLMDGSLLPWLSSSRLDPEASTYRSHLLAARSNLLAGVISSPKSRLLSRLAALVLHTSELATDVEYMQALLAAGQRSAVFLHGSPHNQRFILDQAGIYFFFLRINTHEIARIEIPQWVALDPAAVESVASAVLEDSRLSGYSYALTQAHHHVVISKDICVQLQSRASAEYHQLTGRPAIFSAKQRAKQA